MEQKTGTGEAARDVRPRWRSLLLRALFLVGWFMVALSITWGLLATANWIAT